MPAAYAHITLANRLAVHQRVPAALRDAADKWFRFVELGAVSPDLPYLVLGPGSGAAESWADDMHVENGGAMIMAGAAELGKQAGENQERCLAWLMGYISHVVADLVIHPIVNRIAGEPYADHKLEHRTCEMHQDVHIWSTMNLGAIGLAEHLDSGIRRCGTRDGVDAAIRSFWNDMLKSSHPAHHLASPPDIDQWFCRFVDVLDKIAEEGGRLLPIARHVAQSAALVYPDDCAPQYIKAVPTPDGPMDYAGVFNKATDASLMVWADLDRALSGQQFTLCEASWNLDTGRSSSGTQVFWS